VTISAAAIGALLVSLAADSTITVDATGNIVATLNSAVTATIALSASAALSGLSLGQAATTIQVIADSEVTAASGSPASAVITIAGTANAHGIGDSTASSLITISGAGHPMGLGYMVATTVESGLTPTGIARAVWDSVASQFMTDGTMGAKLNAAGSAGDPWTGVIEGSLTAKDVMRLILAVQTGRTVIVDNGDGTATVRFRDQANTKNRITATMDGSERTAVTNDPT
jgi:hypothetical protein